MSTPVAPPAGTSTSAVTENDLFLMLTTLFSDRRPMPGKNCWELPWMRVGRPAIAGSSRSAVRSSIGSTLYFVASISHSRCSCGQHLGVLGGQVVGLAEVGAAVVQLPDVVVEGRQVPPTMTHGVRCLVTALQPRW